MRPLYHLSQLQEWMPGRIKGSRPQLRTIDIWLESMGVNVFVLSGVRCVWADELLEKVPHLRESLRQSKEINDVG